MPDPLAQPKPGRRARAAKPVKTWRDLLHVGRKGDVVTFGAPSDSDPDRTNLVDLDVATGEVHCTCRYCEHHPDDPGRCWLTREVKAAWWAHQYRQMPTAKLERRDRDYMCASAKLSPEQIARWGLVGEELARRAALKGQPGRKAVA